LYFDLDKNKKEGSFLLVSILSLSRDIQIAACLSNWHKHESMSFAKRQGTLFGLKQGMKEEAHKKYKSK
jgi:hypothetical protein